MRYSNVHQWPSMWHCGIQNMLRNWQQRKSKYTCSILIIKLHHCSTRYHFITFDLDLGVMVTQHVVQYPPHHMTYAPAKFEVATSNGLGDAFTKIHSLTLTLVLRSH